MVRPEDSNVRSTFDNEEEPTVTMCARVVVGLRFPNRSRLIDAWRSFPIDNAGEPPAVLVEIPLQFALFVDD